MDLQEIPPSGPSRLTTRILSRLSRLTKGSGFAKAVSLIVGGTVLGQSVTVLVAPIIARIYGPANIGLFSVYSQVVSVLVVASSLCYDKAILQPQEDSEAINLVALCLIVTSIVSAVFGVALLVFGTALLRLLNAPSLHGYLWLMPLSLLGAGFFQTLMYWAYRKKAYKQISATKLYQSLGQVAAQLAVGLLRAGPLGLICGDIVNRVAGISTIGRILRDDAGKLERIDRRTIRELAHKYRRFPLFSSWAELLHNSANALPAVIIAALYGPVVVGLYFFGQRFIWAPLTIISQTAGQVFFGQAADLARDDPEQLRRFYLKTSFDLAKIGFLPILVIGLFGRPIFAFAFGPDWAEAGLYMQLYAVSMFVQFVAGPVAPILHLMHKQHWVLASEIFGFITIVGGLILTQQLGYPPRTAMVVLGVTWSALFILLYVLALKGLNQHIAEHNARLSA